MGITESILQGLGFNNRAIKAKKKGRIVGLVPTCLLVDRNYTCLKEEMAYPAVLMLNFCTRRNLFRDFKSNMGRKPPFGLGTLNTLECIPSFHPYTGLPFLT